MAMFIGSLNQFFKKGAYISLEPGAILDTSNTDGLLFLLNVIPVYLSIHSHFKNEVNHCGIIDELRAASTD
jgi:hypothetical protein